LNLAFFFGHANRANLAGLFEGSASISFTFMAVSAFLMVSLSAAAIWMAIRRRGALNKLRGGAVWRSARIALSIFAVFFIAIESLIFAASLPTEIPNTKEALILGAHVSSEGPSPTLYSRLVAGAQYALANPDAVLIVSGGRGLDEPVSEAEAMREFLIRRGVDARRIVTEDKSHNTFENLVNTREMLSPDDNPYPITIITSEFHVCRTAMLAARAGFKPYFLPAPTPPGILPSYYSREFFGLIKSFFADR